MSRETKQTALHLSPETAELVAKHADLNNRSRHSEMLHRLEASFGEPVAELDPNAREVVEARIQKVFTACFASLEERVLGHLGRIIKERELVTELKVSGTPAEQEALRAAMRNAHPLYFFPEEPGNTGNAQHFDFAEASIKASARDTLSDQEPVSGINTLAATILATGRRFSGGICGMPAGELPKILERGEQVIDLSQWKQLGLVPCSPEEEALLGAVRTSEGLTIGGVTFGPGTKISKTLEPTHGVDQVLNVTRWTENAGSMPVPPHVRVEIKVVGRATVVGPAGGFVWTLEDEPEVGDITHWRRAE